jgi:hypothetical protein
LRRQPQESLAPVFQFWFRCCYSQVEQGPRKARQSRAESSSISFVCLLNGAVKPELKREAGKWSIRRMKGANAETS